MSLDAVDLRVKLRTGRPAERAAAEKLLPLVREDIRLRNTRTRTHTHTPPEPLYDRHKRRPSNRKRPRARRHTPAPTTTLG